MTYMTDMFESQIVTTDFVSILLSDSWQREELRSDHDIPIVTAGNMT